MTAEPELSTYKLTDADDFLILGTDGIWDVMSAEEVVQSVKATVKVYKLTCTQIVDNSLSRVVQDPYMCAKKLVMSAYQRGSEDNISVIVVFLKKMSTCERVY